jgi:hypothetical protein
LRTTTPFFEVAEPVQRVGSALGPASAAAQLEALAAQLEALAAQREASLPELVERLPPAQPTVVSKTDSGPFFRQALPSLRTARRIDT